MIILQSWEVKSAWEIAYEAGEIGAALATGKGYSWTTEKEHHDSKPNEPTSWEAPIYPFIIAAVFKVFGIFSKSSVVILIILQILISAMSCVLLFLIGRHIFNEWVGILAALLFAMYPAAIHFAVQKIYPTSPYLFLLLLIIFQVLRLTEDFSLNKSISTGLITGIGILCAPFVIIFLPFFLGWLLYRAKGDLKSRTFGVILLILAVCLTISPWLIRNYMVFDRFIPVRSNLGRELLLGNYGKEKLGDSEREHLKTVDEGERSAIYEKIFLESLVEDPWTFAHRVYERVKCFWTALPRIGGPYVPKTGKLSEQILAIYYLFILFVGITGLFISRLRNRGTGLLALCLLSIPIPFYLTWFSRFRYRFPVEVILIIFASYSIYRFWKLFSIKWPAVCLRQ